MSTLLFLARETVRSRGRVREDERMRRRSSEAREEVALVRQFRQEGTDALRGVR